MRKINKVMSTFETKKGLVQRAYYSYGHWLATTTTSKRNHAERLVQILSSFLSPFSVVKVR